MISSNGNYNAVFVSGNTGEGIVQSILDQSDLKYYHNLYLKDSSGNISQIDFLVVSSRVVICIEVKNYSKCVIKGGEDVLKWTACYRSGSRTFLNPISQNDKHVRACKDILGADVPVFNIVVFSNSCNIRIEQLTLTNTQVINMSDLWYSLIDLKVNSANKRFNKNKFDEMISVLDTFEAHSAELYEQHQRQHFKKS